MPNIRVTKNVSEPSFSRYDDRKGLGYGVLDGGFHSSRQSQSTYPYKVDNLEDTDFEDEETAMAINQKVASLYVNDPMAAAGTDKFYFAGGNTKLSDCFFRIDKVLKEVAVFSDSMSPVPVTNRPSAGMSGSGASFPSGVKSRPMTGSGKGYASAPPKSEIQLSMEYEEDIEPEEEFYSLKDLANSIES